MSKVVIFGVTGYAGGKIAAELVSRGHEVVGVARHAKEVGAGVELLTGSIHDEAFVADVTKGPTRSWWPCGRCPARRASPSWLPPCPCSPRCHSTRARA